MKKRQRALLFYNQIEQILLLYGDDNINRKIEFAKNFLIENFGVDEFEDSYIEIERVHTKRLMWLLVTLIIEYEFQNPKELNGFDDSTSQKMKITEEKIGNQKNYLSLEVEDIFPIRERTVEETQFIEKYLDKMNVDLEAEDPADYILSTKQLVFLLSGLIKAWNTTKGRSSNNQ